jgi:hypothetical protein
MANALHLHKMFWVISTEVAKAVMLWPLPLSPLVLQCKIRDCPARGGEACLYSNKRFDYGIDFFCIDK